jgi:hypothetical protein
MNYFCDLTLQRTVLAERSQRLQRDADLARLRRLLRRRSRAERASSGSPGVAVRKINGGRNVGAVLVPPRHQAA